MNDERTRFQLVLVGCEACGAVGARGQRPLTPGFVALRQGAGGRARSDRQGIEVADVAGWDAGQGEGALTGAAIVAFAFRPRLGGLEVPIDRPEGRRPRQAVVGAVVATP